MARPKGLPKTGGRKPGTPNKLTADLKEAILTAADEAHPEGKVGYLRWLATNNSSAFSGLLGKVLPLTLAGDPENPLKVEDVTKHTDEQRARAMAAFIAKTKAKAG